MQQTQKVSKNPKLIISMKINLIAMFIQAFNIKVKILTILLYNE